MKFFIFFALLCSISLAYARALAQDFNISAPSEVLEHLKTNVSISPVFLGATNASVAFGFDLTAVHDYKTVIPDLTALGYTWFEAQDEWYLEYENIMVDALNTRDSSRGTTMIEVTFAYNSGLDVNPHKVPLRDILLSYWKYIEGKDVKNLECVLYENVVEKNMRALIPEIYPLLGRDIADDMKNEAVVELRPGATGGEGTAYSRLLNGCPFPNGAKKMLAEYEEFAGRQLGNFEIRWTGGSSLDFVVYFPM